MPKRPLKLLTRLAAFILIAAVFCSAAYARDDVSPWLKEEYEKAEIYGLVPAILQDKNLNQSITRREFCHLSLLVYEAFGGTYQEGQTGVFFDCGDTLVDRAYSLGIVTGYDDGAFRPDQAITRQEIFKLLYNLLTVQGYIADTSHNEAIESLRMFEDSALIQEWAALPASVLLEAQVTNGISDTQLNPTGATSRDQAVVLTYRLYNAITDGRLPCQDSEPYDEVLYHASDGTVAVPKDEPLDAAVHVFVPVWDDSVYTAGDISVTPGANMGYYEKYEMIFGSADAPKYQSGAEAMEHMTEITVPIWNYNTEGIKVSTSRTFLIHENIASTVMLIFEEIYNGEEKFPIYSVGGYSWRGDGASEHNWGIAIDLNPDENMMIRNGTILAGELWEPGVNKYSIPEDGDVVRAFAKYGWAWGGNAWQSNNDYMHFSFFGN